LNLIAKLLLKQFEVAKKSESDDNLTEEGSKLLQLAEDLNEEELTTADEIIDEDGEVDVEDRLEDWVDEVEALTPDDHELLEDDIRPVKMVLVKVSPCHKYVLLTRD
jgi:hypothetical protein